MGLGLVLLHLFTAMVAINLIFAQPPPPPLRGFFGRPIFGNNNSNESGPAIGIDPSRPGPRLPNIPGLGPRQERSADPGDDDQEPRLFLGRRVACNYTTQGGVSCSSCRRVLACFPNNIGRVRTCRGFARYCNDGRCSIFQGEQCTSTNSTG